MLHSKMKRLFLVVLLIATATLSGASLRAQIGMCALPTGPLLPDLIVDKIPMQTEIYLSLEHFNNNDCAIQENCVDKPGNQLLLRFTSSTPNIGKAALIVGDPTLCPNLFDLLHFSECHQHYHYQHYAAYRLWTPAGYLKWFAQRDLTQPADSGNNKVLLDAAEANGDLIVGRKQGFCLEDSRPYPINGQTSAPPVYQNCFSNQGLSVGWADVYSSQIPCQYIQVTDVPDGYYVLEDQVNPDQSFPESDYTNNSTAIRLYFKQKHGNDPFMLQVLE
jgi:hypothetical protein